MVDFSETVLLLISVVFPAVWKLSQGILDIGLSWLKTKTPFYFLIPEEELQRRLDDIMLKALDFATAKVKESGSLTVKHDNKYVLYAMEYAKKSMPGILKYFKITDERLAEMVDARLADLKK